MNASELDRDNVVFNKIMQIFDNGDNVVIIGRSLLCVKEVSLKLEKEVCKVELKITGVRPK